MGKPQAPTPPDPVVTSKAQTASNVDTATASARLAAVNQQSPFGSVKYDVIGNQQIGGNNVPQYQQTVSLSPEQQRLYDKSTGIQNQALDTGTKAVGNVQNTIGQPFSLQGLPELRTGAQSSPVMSTYQNVGPAMSFDRGNPVQGSLNPQNLPNLPGANDFSKERQSVEDAYLGRFNTDIARNEADIASKLNAQGLQQGSEAWNREMERVDRTRVDARNAAIQAGGAEQSRLFNQAASARGQLFGEDVTKGNFANQAQAQDFGQRNVLADFYNQAAGQASAQNQAGAGFYNSAQQQGFNQDLQNAGMGNQARQQAINEQQISRNQPLNELASLLGMSQIQTPSGAPNFGVQVNPTDVLGAYAMQQQGLQNNYNQQMQAKSSMWNALGGLGGMLGGAAIMGPR